MRSGTTWGGAGRAIAVALVSGALVAVAVPVLTARRDRAERELARTDRIVVEVERATRLLVDAESAVRGFLLTGDDTFLAPLQEASAEVPDVLDALVAHAAGDRVQRRRTADFARLAGRRLTIAESAAAADPGERDELLAVLDTGRATTDEVRALGADVLADSASVRASAEDDADRWRRLLLALPVGIAVLGAVAVAVLVRREQRRTTSRLGVIVDAVAEATAPLGIEAPDDGDQIERLGALLAQVGGQLAVREGSADNQRRFREYLTATAAPVVTLIEVVGSNELAHVSTNALRILGWSEEAITAGGLRSLVDDDDVAAFDELVARPGLGDSATGVVRLRRPDGTTRRTELIVLVAGTDEQRIRTYFATDVHELHAAIEDARAMRAMAEQANTAKNEFLSRMSHELRTPLNAILGFTQLLELDALEPQQEEAVGQILRAGRHLLGLINEVLDIARIETGRLAVSSEPVPIAEVLDEAWELVAIAAAERGIVLRVEPPIDRQVHVRADQQRLKQVFVNMLSNAVKYSARDTQIIVGHEVRDSRFRVIVRDAGPGIAPDKIGRLFQPFERLGLDAQTDAVEGVGLGLALSKALVEAMHGAIGVDSEVGAGSRFWVELDVVAAPTADVDETEAAVTSEATLGTILYVEDNSSNLRLVERILGFRPGIALVGATTGADGLARAEQLRPDVILLDLDLPDMRGERVLDTLRGEAWGRDIPVVVLSADVTPGITRRLAELGASAHLTKPVDVQQLLEVIDGLMASPV